MPTPHDFRPFPPTDTALIYHLTAPSRASRATALKGNNRKSFIGALVPFINGRWQLVVFESRLELMTAYILLAKPRTTDLWDQPTSVQFVGPDGRIHKHTFDYLLTIGGRRLAVAVKPTEYVAQINFKLTLGLVKAQMGNFADDVLLVTEQSFTRHQAHNAELIHFIGRERDEEADDVVGRLLASLNGKTSVRDIVGASHLFGRGWRSLVRLSGRGFVRMLDDGRIDDYGAELSGMRIH